MNEVRRIRVLLADDHTLVREGLRQLLAATTDIRVEGEAANGDEALALVKANDYDLAVLDMSMPGISGIELIKRVRLEKPRLRVLVLSMHGEQQYAARALKAGASGYLTKDSASAQLVGAIRKIAAGGVHISEAAAAHLVAAGGFRLDADVARCRQQLAQPLAHQGVVVGNQDADHGLHGCYAPIFIGSLGTRTSTRVPPRGARPISTEPPM